MPPHPAAHPSHPTPQQQGQHPLRERASKLASGILVVRFELPFNTWCGGCGHLMGTGVRFNAEKKAVGAYHSTKIWEFAMTTPCCSTRLVVRTDPAAAQYVIVEGGTAKAGAFSSGVDVVAELADERERATVRNDPLARLEAGVTGARAAAGNAARLAALAAASASRYGNDYAANKTLRRGAREARREAGALDARRAALGLPETVRLLPLIPDDALRASAAAAAGGSGRHAAAWRQAVASGAPGAW